MSSDERPWYDDLSPEEYAELFPRGKPDVEAWIERDAWRERNQGLPTTCEDPGVLEGIARMILGGSDNG